MDTYNDAAEEAARAVTHTFSTSFSRSIRFFDPQLRRHIYNLYGLVRVADEVVDSYQGDDARQILDRLEADVYQALKSGYSSNVIIHAFQLTARLFDIDKKLIRPFFESMRMDVEPSRYKATDYQSYIYGSAEVVGLMCLKVFCEGNKRQYEQLAAGAGALGSAFQKINFLRDMADDYYQLHRYYFPVGTFESFDEETKKVITDDISNQLRTAKAAIDRLPKNAHMPVLIAYQYYQNLFVKLQRTDAETIKRQRLRVNDLQKQWIVARTVVQQKIKGK